MARRTRPDDDGVPIRSRPRPKPWVYPLAVGGVVAGLVACVVTVGVVIALRGGGEGTPTAVAASDKPGVRNTSEASRPPAAPPPARPTSRGKMPDPIPVIDPSQLVNPLAQPQDVVLNPNPVEGVEGVNWTLEQLGRFLKAKGSITDYEIHERVARRAPSSQYRDTPKRLMLATTKGGVTVEVTEWGGKIAAAEEVDKCVDDMKKKSVADVAYWGKFVAEALEVNGDTAVDAFAPLPAAKKLSFGESKNQKAAKQALDDFLKAPLTVEGERTPPPTGKKPGR